MPPQYLKLLHWSAALHYAVLLLGWQKKKNLIGLTALANIKITELANQIKVGRV